MCFSPSKPSKTCSPMKTPTKENYMDRYMPSRSCSKFKNPTYSFSKALFQSPSQLSTHGSRQGEGTSTALSISSANRTANANSSLSRSAHSVLNRSTSDSVLSDKPPHMAIVSTLVHIELTENTDTSDFPNSSGLSSNGSSVFSPRENLNVFSVSLHLQPYYPLSV